MRPSQRTHQLTQFTLYIYIKVLLVLASYICGYAGVAAGVRHLSVLDPNNAAAGCYGHVIIHLQDL